MEVLRAAKGNTLHTVVRRRPCMASMDRTASVDFTVIMNLTASMGRTAGVDFTVSMDLMANVEFMDVAFADSMRVRGIAVKEKEDSFRSILTPGGPRDCMHGCENAGTTCIIGRGHTSAKNAC